MKYILISIFLICILNIFSQEDATEYSGNSINISAGGNLAFAISPEGPLPNLGYEFGLGYNLGCSSKLDFCFGLRYVTYSVIEDNITFHNKIEKMYSRAHFIELPVELKFCGESQSLRLGMSYYFLTKTSYKSESDIVRNKSYVFKDFEDYHSFSFNLGVEHELYYSQGINITIIVPQLSIISLQDFFTQSLLAIESKIVLGF